MQDELYDLCRTLKHRSFFGKDVTTHFMRHTHVALMAEHGIPLNAISRRLGHANSAITRDIYFHVTKRLQERDNARIRDVKIL